MKISPFFRNCLLLSAVAIACQSCISEGKRIFSSTKIATETRPLKGFEEIEINGSPTVYYTQADSFSVFVKGPDEGVDRIITEVDGHVLKVRNQGKVGLFNVQFGEEFETAVYVTSPDIVSVRVNGSGDFISSHRIDTDRMHMVLRGSGDISLADLICDDCQVNLIGSGDIDIDCVEAKSVDVSLVGSGDIETHQANVLSTKINLKGSGDIKASFASACQQLDCQLHGSGDISLSGEVAKFQMHKGGSGDIDANHLKVNN